jgi:hypothetical protein
VQIHVTIMRLRAALRPHPVVPTRDRGQHSCAVLRYLGAIRADEIRCNFEV